MFRRILDPSPIDGNGGPASVSSTTVKVETTPIGTIVPPSELESLYAERRELTEIKANMARAIEIKEQEKLMALAQKGDIEKAMKELKESMEKKVAARESKLVARERDAVIASNLAGVEFRDTVAAHTAMKLLSMEIDSSFVGDEVLVRDKSGRPASDFMKEWLKGPVGSLFVKPSTQGGAGSTGTATTQSNLAVDPLAATLGPADKRQAGHYPSLFNRRLS